MIYMDANHKFLRKIPWYLTAFCVVSCVSFAKPDIVRAASSIHYQVIGAEAGDQRKHMIDIDISVMNETAMTDCEDMAEFKISLTNTGTEPLTDFDVSLTKPDIYELFCEKKGVRHKLLLSHESSQNETEEIDDMSITLPDTLAPDETVTVYAVNVPEHKTEADQDSEIFIVYTNETNRYEVPLKSIVEKNQEGEIQEAEPFTEQKKEDSEIISEKITESDQTENEENSDIETKPADEMKNNAPEGSTNGKELVSEKETEKKESENKHNEEINISDVASDNFVCEVMNIERTKGCYIGNIFFATKESQYIVHFSSESSVEELNYRIGAFSGIVSVKDGFALIDVPENISDTLEIFCTDPNQNKMIICSEYVVNENIAPAVHYEKTVKDGKSYASVTIEDSGDIISGLMDCSVYMDGNFIDISESSELERINLFGKYEVVSSRQYTVLLEDGKTHSFEIFVKDYTGNTVSENFSIEKEKEIVNVVLPTSFNILVLPDDQENQLYGEDIVLCNKSNFPVQVDVTSAQVQVDHTAPNNAIDSQINSDIGGTAQNKKFDLSLQLLQADKPTTSVKLPEGNTENVTSFVLSGKNTTTDFEALQKSGTSEVNSRDYAVMNVRGTINQDMKHHWKNDDLHVKIVFRFNKLGETD